MLAAVTACAISISILAGLAVAEPSPVKPTETAGKGAVHAMEASGSAASTSPFLNESQFKTIAVSKHLTLKANEATGNFIVTDKRTGYTWKSFPDDKGYNDKVDQGKWKVNLQSPIMFRYVEFNVRIDLATESNLIDEKGGVSRFEVTDRGFKVTYEIPSLGFVIPAEVILGDDYVETRLLKDGLKDGKTFTEEELKTKKDNIARLVSVRLFPFLGAQTSEMENGYMLLPDGSGAIVDFKKERGGTNNYYEERVYGPDWAYSANNTFSIRNPVKLPVFGIKAGEQAMIGVIRNGAEYASIVAAPSKTFSQYNWVSAEQNFRFKYYQYTNTKKTSGYMSFSKEMIASDRSVRYYLIGQKDAGYVQMAARYRQYLTEEVGVQPLKLEGSKLALQLSILGADSKKGFLWDSYLPLTTTRQAQEIVQELNTLGVERMAVTYLGWQRGGYSKFGGSFPLAGKLGGIEGMEQFVDFAHAKGFPGLSRRIVLFLQ